jgi:hypothetical protein
VNVSLAVTTEGVTATQAQDVALKYVAPVLRVVSLDCTPEPARAGKAMVGRARILVTRHGTPEALPATTKAKWTATIGTLKLKPLTTRLAPGGVLVSTWKLPKTVKGKPITAKTVRITVALVVEQASVTKTHLHRIA